MAVTKKVEDFRRSWVFVETSLADEALLQLPTDQPEKHAKKCGSARL